MADENHAGRDARTVDETKRLQVNRYLFTNGRREGLPPILAHQHFGMSMSIEWIPRLRGHVDLVKRLVEEVPLALDRPGLTIGQAERLQAVIEKGARDFDDVVRLMSGPDEREYSDAAKSLTNIWSHLAGIAADKVQYLNDRATAKTDSRRDERGETE